MGKFQRAFVDYSAAIRLDSNDPFFFSARGVCHRKLRRNKEALQDLSVAIEMNSTEPSFYFNRGLAYFDEGNFVAAIEDFSRAIGSSGSVHRHTYRALFNRATCFRKCHRLDRAVRDLEQAVEVDPSAPAAHNALALALCEQGRFSAALESLNVALDAAPTNPMYLTNRGLVLYHLGQLRDAMTDLNHAIQLSPAPSSSEDVLRMDASSFFHRGNVHLAMGHTDRALFDFERAVRLSLLQSGAPAGRTRVRQEAEDSSEMSHEETGPARGGGMDPKGTVSEFPSGHVIGAETEDEAEALPQSRPMGDTHMLEEDEDEFASVDREADGGARSPRGNLKGSHPTGGSSSSEVRLPWRNADEEQEEEMGGGNGGYSLAHRTRLDNLPWDSFADDVRLRLARQQHSIGLALQAQQRFPEAESHFRWALEAWPSHGPSRYHLALMLLAQDAPSEAEVELSEVLSMEQDAQQALQEQVRQWEDEKSALQRSSTRRTASERGGRRRRRRQSAQSASEMEPPVAASEWGIVPSMASPGQSSDRVVPWGAEGSRDGVPAAAGQEGEEVEEEERIIHDKAKAGHGGPKTDGSKETSVQQAADTAQWHGRRGLRRILEARGLAWQALGRHADAEEDFTRGLVLEPERGELYYHRAVSALCCNEPDSERALRDLNSAVERGFHPGEVWDRMATAHLLRHDLVAAMKSYTEAITKDPSHRLYRRRRAQCYREMGDAAAAEKDLSIAMSTLLPQGGEESDASMSIEQPRFQGTAPASPSPLRLSHRGRAAPSASSVADSPREVPSGQSAKGSSFTTTTRRPLPAQERSELQFLRGLCRYDQDDFDAAVEDFQDALNGDPTEDIAPHIHYSMGLALANSDNYADAERSFTRALATGRDCLAEERLQFWHERAKCRQMLGNHKGAISDFNVVLGMNPRNAHAHFRRGFSHKALRMYSEAAEDFESANAYDPHNPHLSVNYRTIHQVESIVLCAAGEEPMFGDVHSEPETAVV